MVCLYSIVLNNLVPPASYTRISQIIVEHDMGTHIAHAYRKQPT